jgi:N-acetyl sugar amidotransferase
VNIAYFADSLCSHGAKWINHFAADSENTVILLSTPDNPGQQTQLSERVIRYPILPRAFPLRRPLQRRAIISQIRCLLKRHRNDIVHSMYVVPYGLWASESGFANHIVTTRGSDVLMDYSIRFKTAHNPWQAIGNWMLRRLFVRTVTHARATTSTSGQQQRALWQMGCNPSQTYLIRTGVDTERFARTLVAKRAPVHQNGCLLFAPRLVQPHYNTRLLVEVLDRLRQPPLRVAATLRLTSYLADSDYLARVLADAGQLGLRDSIEVLPPLSADELLSSYLAADLAIMTPRTDGTPVTAIEAMLAGTPLVITDLPYDADLFSDDQVWRVPADDPEAIARTVASVLSASPVERQAKTDRARAAALRYADLRTELQRVAVLYAGGRPHANVRECMRCILNTADDPAMTFDATGRCSHCAAYEQLASALPPTEARSGAFAEIVAAVQAAGSGRRYDSIMGLSGGLDSSFACLLAKRAGLNPLVVHLDNGWNSELASHNIENIVKALDLDLYTHVIDWREFRDLQLAFLKASVVDTEMLTDHAIGAILLHEAARRGIRYIISGSNVVTEGILPRHWYHDKTDWLNIKAIQRLHGSLKLRTYPHVSYLFRQYCSRVRGIRVLPLLNFVDYNRARAKAELSAAVGWRDYGEKHTESLFTRFYQQYILPRKFGIEKRKAHLATLICSGQITRTDALRELAVTPSAEVLERDREYVLKKLGLDETAFEALMRTPPRSHLDYPSYVKREYLIERRLASTLRGIREKSGLPVREAR